MEGRPQWQPSNGPSLDEIAVDPAQHISSAGK